MKRLMCLLMLFMSINVFAISPSFLSGKTYMGEVVPERGSSFASAAIVGEIKMLLKFKNSSQADMTFIVVPSGYQIETLIKLAGVSDSDLVNTFPVRYKIDGDTLKIIDDVGTSDFMIVRNGEAIVVDDRDRYGFTSVLTPYK